MHLVSTPMAQLCLFENFIPMGSFTLHSVEAVHVAVFFSASFLFLAEYYSTVWTYHSGFIHSPVGGDLDYSYFLAILKKAEIFFFFFF